MLNNHLTVTATVQTPCRLSVFMHNYTTSNLQFVHMRLKYKNYNVFLFQGLGQNSLKHVAYHADNLHECQFKSDCELL